MAARHRCEPLGKVRTKIVATLGPASRSPETIRSLIEAGVDVFRLNFSHASHEEHTETLARVRQEADAAGRVVAVLQDLGGPKIRLGEIPGDAVDCHLDDEFVLLAGDADPSDAHQLTCTYPSIVDELKPGDDVFFADGTVAMRVTEAGGGRARMTVTLPGRVRSHQGLNLPGAALSVKSLTDKDLRDLDWTRDNPVDYVGLSFARTADDVAGLRRELDARGIAARIIVKIEKPQAVANLEAILDETDAVMVARGDLGVEVDVARVPAIQKRVIAACRRARVPVITATQMLNSMETSTRPTRAEATDVFNAVLDGTDAVMLSGETAVGQYPVEAVETMSRIVTEAETLMLSDPASPWPSTSAGPAGPLPGRGRGGWVQPITEGIVEAVGVVSRRLGARLVAVATKSGRTALALSKQRYAAPTLALTDDPNVARAMALYWGITPLLCRVIDDHEQAGAFVHHWAAANELTARGDTVILVRGTMPAHPSHNAMLVEVVD
ncbi:MAG: pyruvate kinase [Isosphaeraceae bacterium]